MSKRAKAFRMKFIEIAEQVQPENDTSLQEEMYPEGFDLSALEEYFEQENRLQ